MKSLGLMIVLVLAVTSSRIVEADHPNRPLTIARVDFDGAADVWVAQVIDNRYVWDAIISTEGWAEIDLGLNFTAGNWYLQPLIGLDFFQSGTRTKSGSFLPQFYALHYGATHAEFWYIGSRAWETKRWNHHSRLIASQQLGQSANWLGGQYDLSNTEGLSPHHLVGPLVERQIISSTKIALTVQKQIGGRRSQFLISVQSLF